MSSSNENDLSATESTAKYVPVLMPIESIGEIEKGSNGQSNNSRQTSMNIASQSMTYNTNKKNELPTCNSSLYERFEHACESCFQIKERGSSTSKEIFLGCIAFVSCMYCLPVVSNQLVHVGYDGFGVITAISLWSGVGTIMIGLLTDLPFVAAPPTSISILFAGFLESSHFTYVEGNVICIISGLILIGFGYRHIGYLVARLIPLPIQVGTTIGIGLITALAGAEECGLVQKGGAHILQMGPINAETSIVIAGIIIIISASYYHMKAAFAMSVIFCSAVWWLSQDIKPGSVAIPVFTLINSFDCNSDQAAAVFELVFVYVLYMDGLVSSLCRLGNLVGEDGVVKNAAWVYPITGGITVIAGVFSSAPILISPESAAGIKAGARTGLSSLVCGILFLASVFFGPFFEDIPFAGTAPALIMVRSML